MLAELNIMQPTDYDQGLNQGINQPLRPIQTTTASSSHPQHHHSPQSQPQSLDMPYQLPGQMPQQPLPSSSLPPYNPPYDPQQQGQQGHQQPVLGQQQWLPQWQSSYPQQAYSRLSFAGPATTNPQSQYRFDSYDDHSSSSLQGIRVLGSQGSSAAAVATSSQPKSPMDNFEYSKQRASGVHSSSHSTVYSFVPLPGAQQQKRPRRKYEDIERIYNCNYPNCTKAYGTLNHLNAHITMQGHGEKRTPAEFKEIRRLWKLKKKEQDAVAAHRHSQPGSSQVSSHHQSTGVVAGHHQPGVINDSSNPYFSSNMPLYNSDSVRSFDPSYYKES